MAAVAITTDTTMSVATPVPVMTDTVTKAAMPEEQILLAPIDVYFEANKTGITKTPEVEMFLADAKKYFEKYPEKILQITGHSDSDGSDELNQRLSERRAEQTKAYFVKEGIKSSQIMTDGKGEKEPLASNDTAEGKAQNRRSTIRLKQ